MRRLFVFVATWLALCGSVVIAQQVLPGFPPGAFSNKAALDPAAGGGGTTVTFDAKATAETLGTATSSLSNANLTIGTGHSNYALIVQLIYSYPNGIPPSAPAVTWNGTTMTLLATQASNAGSVHTVTTTLWGLLAPTSGNHTIAASWTGTASDAFLFGESFYNVNSFQNATSTFAHSANPSLTITSAANNVVVDSLAYFESYVSNNLTLLLQDDTNGTISSWGSQYGLSSSSSTTASWVTTPADEWALVGVDLKHQ